MAFQTWVSSLTAQRGSVHSLLNSVQFTHRGVNRVQFTHSSTGFSSLNRVQFPHCSTGFSSFTGVLTGFSSLTAKQGSVHSLLNSVQFTPTMSGLRASSTSGEFHQVFILLINQSVKIWSALQEPDQWVVNSTSCWSYQSINQSINMECITKTWSTSVQYNSTNNSFFYNCKSIFDMLNEMCRSVLFNVFTLLSLVSHIYYALFQNS